MGETCPPSVSEWGRWGCLWAASPCNSEHGVEVGALWQIQGAGETPLSPFSPCI